MLLLIQMSGATSNCRSAEIYLGLIQTDREIKFGELLNQLPLRSALGSAWFATGVVFQNCRFPRFLITISGHYAATSWTHSGSTPRPKLVRPIDRKKDQTYFPSAVSEAGLGRALFPLARLTKPEVRVLARQRGLATATRPDSVGICFVGQKTKFDRFLGMCPMPF